MNRIINKKNRIPLNGIRSVCEFSKQKILGLFSSNVFTNFVSKIEQFRKGNSEFSQNILD